MVDKATDAARESAAAALHLNDLDLCRKTASSILRSDAEFAVEVTTGLHAEIHEAQKLNWKNDAGTLFGLLEHGIAPNVAGHSVSSDYKNWYAASSAPYAWQVKGPMRDRLDAWIQALAKQFPPRSEIEISDLPQIHADLVHYGKQLEENTNALDVGASITKSDVGLLRGLIQGLSEAAAALEGIIEPLTVNEAESLVLDFDPAATKLPPFPDEIKSEESQS